jgi:Tol biopolymer transport system component
MSFRKDFTTGGAQAGVLAVTLSALALAQAPATNPAIDVTVDEGTSMSVAVSPDGRTLAIDLQGSIWTLPAAGGTATRISGVFDDARQPAWSPDGKTIAFFGYRDGGYDIWAIAPDGRNQRKLTWGPYDDREPAFSHDGARLAFSSDRQTGDYNIWILDLGSGELRQLTKDKGNDFMPAWSPDDREIAFTSLRGTDQGVHAMPVAGGAERRISTRGRADAPSWGPGGQIVHHVTEGQSARLELDGKPLTGTENAFAFRPSWTSATDFFYVSDGRIRKRSLNGGEAQTVAFQATLQVTRPSYTRRKRDFDSSAPRRALGIVKPVLSPDASQVAFAALGDIYLMPVGGKPVNLTRDAFLDTEPAWSPDGTQLAYSSDKGGKLLQLYVRDVRSGRERQLTTLDTQPMGAAWSPDGKRIAFLDVDGMWRRASVAVVDVATGKVTKIHDSLFGPGAPAWSPDGTRVALAMVLPFSTRFREGTNQVLTLSAEGGDERWYSPIANLSIDSRGGCGPAWSPDGTKMAAVYEGVLAVWPVAASGEPLGPPRRITTEIAHAPSWAGDSRRILYQSLDTLKIVDVESGETRDVPLDLEYTLDVPKDRSVLHAGRLVDGKSETARPDIDIVIEGNRIRSVQPHSAASHANARVIDAAGLTAMPGLVEFHSHLQKDFGSTQARAFLSFGVTAVRSPGGTPYEAVEDREVIDAGVRPGPRVFSTGYLMEWQRVYYKMGVAISGPAHFERELLRAKVLQHDLIKSYVRLPDLQQKRMVEFAHALGVPVATHEVYPSTLVGVDNTEHTSGTSRRGYSPKIATLQRSYSDVARLFGAAGTTFCPMISNLGLRKILDGEPGFRTDPRLELYPAWMRAAITGPPNPAFANLDAGGAGRMVVDAQQAGARVVAGTDSPNAANLHGELMAYVMSGMTPYQALRAATVNPAAALGLDAGSIEPGKLADIVIVEGNPLQDIAAARSVRRVIANGRLYEMEELLRGKGPKPSPPASAR